MRNMISSENMKAVEAPPSRTYTQADLLETLAQIEREAEELLKLTPEERCQRALKARSEVVDQYDVYEEQLSNVAFYERAYMEWC